MAIDYQRQETISRSSGRSAVAAMAYITRSQMHDERTNETHNYSKGHAAVDNNGSGVIGWNGDAASLANAMEAADKRKNSRTARTFVGALPNNLTHEKQNELARRIAQDLYEIDGAPLAFVVHRDKANNPHFHIIKATRKSDDGTSFGPKCRIWEDSKTGPKTCKEARRIFIDRTNEALSEIEQTLPIRDSETISQLHLGPAKSAKERKRPGSTPEGRYNQKVKQHEQLKRKLERIRQKKREVITAKNIRPQIPIITIQQPAAVPTNGLYWKNIRTVEKAYREGDVKTAADEMLYVTRTQQQGPQKRAEELSDAIYNQPNTNSQQWPTILEWMVNHPKMEKLRSTLKNRLNPFYEKLTGKRLSLAINTPTNTAQDPRQRNRDQRDYPSR